VYDRVISVEIAEKASLELRDLARRSQYVKKFLCLLHDNRNQKVLDFGCGFGATTRLLTACGINVVAYDPSLVRIDAVKKRCAEAIVTSDIETLRMNAPYSGIILDNVLEHVPDPNSLIELISGILDSGAIIYVSVPSYEKSTVRRLQGDLQRNELSEMTINPWEHLNYFDLAHLDWLMGKHKMSPLRSYEMPGSVELGLRPEREPSRRILNSIATGFRLLWYGLSGRAIESVQNRFYRHTGHTDDFKPQFLSATT
jgi:SAM-dependent methyltransferase